MSQCLVKTQLNKSAQGKHPDKVITHTLSHAHKDFRLI